jgi:proteasome accessory factor A
MSLPKVTGIETEYGILIRGAAESDPFLASRLLLEHCEEAGALLHRSEMQFYGAGVGRQSDAADLDDAPARYDQNAQWEEATAETLNAETEVNASAAYGRDYTGYGYGYAPHSLMLPNGARFYIDHAHPEYSTAEAATPRGVVAADKAGEIIVERCRRRANASGRLPPGQEIAIYKNNSDHKGVSYGCHENYLLAAPTFEALLERKLHRTLMVLVPFLVTRTILCGAGKVGAENGTPPAGFQLAQRADFFETLIGLQTTHHRPLINTRDEPHADARYFRRLHVIVGDANMAEYSTYLKVGATQLVLLMLEDDAIRLNLTLEDPVAAVQAVSRDLTFAQALPLERGGAASALEIQREYLRLAQRYLDERGGSEALREVAQVWEDTLDKLADDWRLLGARLDWAIKRNLLERYLQSQQCDWETVARWQTPVEVTLDLDHQTVGDDPARLLETIRAWYPNQAHLLERYARQEGLNWADYWRQRDIYFTRRRLDLEYHDIRRGPEAQNAGVFYRLQARGAVERLLTDEEIARRVDAPPEDTRAYLRGYCLAHYADRLRHADWSELSFNEPGGRQSYHLALPDPSAGSQAHVGALLAGEPDLPTLLWHLQEQPYNLHDTNRGAA